jgi:TnpA family transposase
LVNFALFDLIGKALTPRIRDLGKITLVRDAIPTATNALYPHAGPLLGARWDEELVADCWDDLLRMAGSLKYGQTTASLSDPVYRRKISRQLNKGESLRSDNINLFGTIDVDIDAELAKLDNGRRPLRPTQLNELGLPFPISP